MARVIALDFTTYAADAICLSQTRTGAGPLVINGSLTDRTILNRTTGFNKFLRPVSLTSAGNLSAVNFTITGFDQNEAPIAQTIAGPNANTVFSTTLFAKVTDISTSATIGTAVTASLGPTGRSWPIPINYRSIGLEIGIGITVSGTINYTLQHTMDEVLVSAANINWFNSQDANFVGQTASRSGSYEYPVSALVIVVNSATHTATLSGRIVETGN
jgi:hypothetical protein